MGKKVGKIVLKVLAVLGVTIALLLCLVLGICYVLIHGPSEAAKNQFVCALNESSAMGFVARIYLSEAEVNAILNNTGIIEVEDGTVSDPDLINIGDTGDETDENSETEDIELVEITGTTYRGYMLIIKDPTRVYLGTVPTFYEGSGMTVQEMAEADGAIAGINGGEFFDAGSYSYSALPEGIVIKDGELIFGSAGTTCNVTGLTEDGVLVIGKMTGQEALDMGLKYALHTKYTTGPFLIIDNEVQVVPDTSVYGGGKNPRTAIGQRADGAILLLVVDGRQANSIGATFEELAYIMKEYGAVNASAMDGGTSTQMYYEGAVVNSPYSPTGPRRCPTCWLVSAE